MIACQTSNRMERLAHALGRHLAEHPLRDPLAIEWIVVQSRGMERFLADHLALETGISAQVAYVFPARVVRALLRAALEETPVDLENDRADPWDPDALVWTILEALPTLRTRPEFAILQDYLSAQEADGPEVRQPEYALARKMADLLDEVATYRPAWARAWSRGDPLRDPEGQPIDEARHGAAWQRVLWRTLEARLGQSHPMARLEEGLDRLRSGPPIPGMPERLSLFGIDHLPPSFLQVFLEAGRRPDLEVRVDVLSCSRGYFGDTPTTRRMARIRSHAPGVEDPDLHGGHPLVRALGRLQVDFNDLLVSHLEDVPEDLSEDPAAGGTPSQLRQVQQQVLDGEYRPDPGADGRPDGSFLLHGCHTLARQVQVLHQEILAALDEDPTLQPRDFLVMCSDVEAAAPLIQAEFQGDLPRGGTRDHVPTLRFGIADRHPRHGHRLVEAVFRLLELADSRLEASRVLDFLALEPVRERFDLSTEDVERLAGKVEEAGIRFGWDAGHREAEGLAREDRFTWAFGMDRLAFGTAASDWAPPDPVAGVVPLVVEDPEDLRRIGSLGAFLEALGDVCQVLRGGPMDQPATPARSARPRAQWARDLAEAIPRLIAIPSGQRFLWHRLVSTLRDLADMDAGSEGRPVDLDTIRGVLEGAMESGPRVSGLMLGGVNFSGLVPMRAIPARVVVLLGMEDEVFPRKERRPAYDLMGIHPLPGDRNPRDEDRHLLLEALLSARDRLWIFWNSRGVRDNQPRPPPTPIEDLLDAVAGTFRGADTLQEVRKRFVIEHPLQPFHPGLFTSGETGRPRSYDARLLVGAEALRAPRRSARPFFPGMESGALPGDTGAEGPPSPPEPLPDSPGRDPLANPAVGAGILQVRLQDLQAALRNPSRFLLRRRLRVDLDQGALVPEDQEPLESDSWKGREWVKTVMEWTRDEDLPMEVLLERLRLCGAVTLGSHGEAQARQIWQQAMALRREFASLVQDPGRHFHCQISFSLPEEGVPELLLTAQIGPVHRAGIVEVCPGQAGPGTLFGACLRHLMALAQGIPFSGRTWLIERQRPFESTSNDTRGIAIPSRRSFRTLSQAQALETLRRFLRRYLEACRGPLALFPNSSWQYARTEDRKEALQKAQKAWASENEESFQRVCDMDDPFIARVFRDIQPWDPEERPAWMHGEHAPEALAIEVYGTVLDLLENEGDPVLEEGSR